jgi:hypothetical protein
MTASRRNRFGIGFLGAGPIFREGYSVKGRHHRRDDSRDGGRGSRSAPEAYHRHRRLGVRGDPAQLRMVTKNIRLVRNGNAMTTATPTRTATAIEDSAHSLT